MQQNAWLMNSAGQVSNVRDTTSTQTTLYPLGDVDGDDRADVAVNVAGSAPRFISGTAAMTSVRLNALTDPTVPGVMSARAFGVGDVNGDGRADIALVSETPIPGGFSYTISLFGASTAMSLPAPIARLGVAEALNPTDRIRVEAVGDVNGDGRDDIAIWGENTSRLAIVSLPESTLTLTPIVSHAFAEIHEVVGLGDFDAPGNVSGRRDELAIVGDVRSGAERAWELRVVRVTGTMVEPVRTLPLGNSETMPIDTPVGLLQR
jgi:hypothetical protein